jgi:hypothetical protein
MLYLVIRSHLHGQLVSCHFAVCLLWSMEPDRHCRVNLCLHVCAQIFLVDFRVARAVVNEITIDRGCGDAN